MGKRQYGDYGNYQNRGQSKVVKGQLGLSAVIVLVFAYKKITGQDLDISVAEAIIFLVYFFYNFFAARNNPTRKDRY